MSIQTRLYNPLTARRWYEQDGDTTKHRHWAIDTLVHDLGALGIPFFEGAGTDPTGLAGYDVDAWWLYTDSGLTDTTGIVRCYDGTGVETDIAAWPLIDLSCWQRLFASTGAFRYVTTWDADTNTPALTSGAGNAGDLYRVGVAGTEVLDGIGAWALGDHLYFDGTQWSKLGGGTGSSAAQIWAGNFFP